MSHLSRVQNRLDSGVAEKAEIACPIWQPAAAVSHRNAHQHSRARTREPVAGGYRTVPTIAFPDGQVLVEPGRGDLLSALGQAQTPEV